MRGPLEYCSWVRRYIPLLVALVALSPMAVAVDRDVRGRNGGDAPDDNWKYEWTVTLEEGDALKDFHVCFGPIPRRWRQRNLEESITEHSNDADPGKNGTPPGWEFGVRLVEEEVDGEDVRLAYIDFYAGDEGEALTEEFTFKARFDKERFARKTQRRVKYFLTGDGNDDHGTGGIGDPIEKERKTDFGGGVPQFIAAGGGLGPRSYLLAVGLVVLALLAYLLLRRASAGANGGP